MYGVEAYIERCLQSIGAQDVPGKMECIIVDDCSPDNSRAVAESFISRYTGSVSFRFITHKKNSGLAAARNTGITASQAEYIMFVDSDDYILPNSLAELICRLDYEKLDILSYRMHQVKNGILVNTSNSQNHPLDKATLSNADYLLNFYPQISACAHIARRVLVCHIRFTEGVIHEDYAYMLQVYAQCDRIGFTKRRIYTYDIKDAGTLSTTKSYQNRERYVADWASELNKLHSLFGRFVFNDDLTKGIRMVLIDFHYAALTCLLKSKLTLKDKKKYLREYRSVSNMFSYGPNHLSGIRRLRMILYCIPGLYPIMLKLLK